MPLEAFARDVRRKAGVRAACKRCDARATARRKAADRPAPGKLVVVNFPAPPPMPPADVAAATPTSPGARTSAGTYSDAAEAFIAALEPPAGPADALLVQSLRGLADLADRYSYGIDVVRDTNALVASMLRVQRELAATRAAKGNAAAPPAPASRLASGQF